MSESKRLSREDVAKLRDHLRVAVAKGFIRQIFDTSAPLAYRGNGVEIPSTWNVLIYHPKRKLDGLKQSVVCTDFAVLRTIWTEDFDALQPSSKEPIYIDDAGWGFPLLGVMIGVNRGDKVLTRMVDVKHFRSGTMATKMYLREYAEHGHALLQELQATPQDCRIEICTGYVNGTLREELRLAGWEVKVAEIEGLLQDQLEELFRQTVVRELGEDIYYDPKALNSGRAIAAAYRDAVAFGQEFYPQLLKTGWKSLQTANC